MAFVTDILLPAVLVLVTVYMAYLGVDVTVNPPIGDKAKRLLKIKFIVCGVAIAALTVTQGLLNSANQHALESALKDFKEKPMQVQVSGFLQFHGIAQLDGDQGKPLIRDGFPVRLNIEFRNAGGSPVSAANFVSRIWTIRANTETDSEIRRNFKKATEPEVAILKPGQTVGVGNRLLKTVSSDHALTKEDVADIIAGRLRVYFLSHYWWQERPEGIDLCNWVGGPLDPVGSESIDKTAWHNCG
jgi:hypothetical protein